MWHGKIINCTWKPKSEEIINIKYISSTSTDKGIYYRKKGVPDDIIYHIKYKIIDESLQVNFISLQIINITSDTDLIFALVQNDLVQEYDTYSPKLKNMLRMENSEEAECTDLNQCNIPSILIWIDMLTRQPKIASPAYDEYDVFCPYTGATPPTQRIKIDSMEFTNSYCHVKYHIFEENEPHEKQILLYNTKDGVRVKIAKCVEQTVESEENMLQILKNNIMHHYG